MSIECPVCEKPNTNERTYCDACGCELPASPSPTEAATTEPTATEASVPSDGASTPVAAAPVAVTPTPLDLDAFDRLLAEGAPLPSPSTEERSSPEPTQPEPEPIPIPASKEASSPLVQPPSFASTPSSSQGFFIPESPYEEDDSDALTEEIDRQSYPSPHQRAETVTRNISPKSTPTPPQVNAPEPGTLKPSVAPSASITLYINRQPTKTLILETDETLIGRLDPISDTYPDFDLSEFDPETHISRRHCIIYRQNRTYSIFVLSNSGTQLNQELLTTNDRRPLKHGDVIVLSGVFAIKFEHA